MLLGVTRELHGETLGPKMPPELEKARKLDFLPPPFGTHFETFSIENQKKTVSDYPFFWCHFQSGIFTNSGPFWVCFLSICCGCGRMVDTVVFVTPPI